MSGYSDLKNRIEKRLTEQEGATLLLALLFFLLCAVCGSVILASATASSGRIAGLGQYRQRYQSVEAVARLLENELHNASVTLQETERILVTTEHVEKDNVGDGGDGGKSEETYTTTTYTFSGPDYLSIGSRTDAADRTGIADAADSREAEEEMSAAAFSDSSGSNSSLSLLEQMLTDADLSSYLLKGETYQRAGTIVISDRDEENSENAEASLSDCQKAWQTAFLTGDSTKCVRRHFTMQLEDIDGDDDGSMVQDSLVEVVLQLYGDGTLELRLSSGDTAQSGGDTAESSADVDTYYMLLRGTAELQTKNRSERSDSHAAGGDSDDDSSETVITRKTILSWGDFVITKNAAEAGQQRKAAVG